MVEKIIVSPESVRGLGNIVLPKTGADFEGVDCTVLVDTDTVGDELVTVYSLESEATILNVVLSVDDGSVMIGDTVTLSASVTDEMTSPVVGASVSFRLNGSVVGSSDTNSSGVATLSYQCNSTGTLSFTGVCNNFTSNSVSVTVTGHSYSLSFDSTDYTVVGGSVVMMVSLSDYGTSVSGASIALSGGGSSWSATTDSTGVATFNLSNVTVGGTYTASYSGVSATCNLIIQTIPYQLVEYLQSNGSQYINTGYILKANDKVEVTVSMQGSGTYNGVFGARKNSYTYNCYALFGRFGGSNKFVYCRTGQEKQGNTISTNVIYDIVTDGANCTISKDGSVVQTITTTGNINDCVNPCGLFVLNTYNGADGFNKDTYGYMKIYSFKITNSSNEVIMDLVPVRNGNTGYMYDKVSGNLMTNNGTFLYGSDI